MRLDRNNYSVPARWVGQIVSVRVTAYSLTIVAAGEIIAEHQRSFIRDEMMCNPWHYLSVLEKKPGAYVMASLLSHGIYLNQYSTSEQNYYNKIRAIKPLLIVYYWQKRLALMRSRSPVNSHWNQVLLLVVLYSMRSGDNRT